MRVRIYPDDADQWLITVDPDEKYVEGPFIEIPDEVAQPMIDVQDRWGEVAPKFAAWVEALIDEKGREDYPDYLTGQITESQYLTRRDGCEHPNPENVGTEQWPRVECPDCGRRHHPERWL